MRLSGLSFVDVEVLLSGFIRFVFRDGWMKNRKGIV